MADQTVAIVFRVLGTGQVVSQMNAMGAATTRMAGTMGTASNKAAATVRALGHVSAIAGKVLLLGVGAALAVSAKAALEFESSFAGVRKTVKASAPELAQLARGLRDLATTIPVNVNELNSIAEMAGQLGIEADSITEFTDTIAKIGVTTNVASEEAAKSFARIANVLQLGQDQFDEMGSTLIYLGNNFATTETEILNFANRIAPIGNIVGLTVDQVFALATAFSSVGVPAERGGTAIQKVFTRMAQATKQGGDHLTTFARIAGTTVDDFTQLFEEDAAAAFSEFLQGLSRIEKSGGDVFSVLQDLQLGNERVVQAVLGLAGAGNLLDSALSGAAGALEENNALNIEAAIRFDTTASKVQLAWNRINDLRIELGENLLPIIGELADEVATFIELIGETGWLTNLLGGLAAAAAVTFTFLGAVKLATKALAVFGVTGAAAAGLVAPLGAAIGLVAVSVGILAKKWVNTRQAAENWRSAIDETTLALNDNTNAVIANQIVQSGIVSDLNLLGISAADLLPALRGEADAYDKLIPKLDAAARANSDIDEGNVEGMAARARILNFINDETDAREDMLKTMEEELRTREEVEAQMWAMASAEDKLAFAQKLVKKGIDAATDAQEEYADGLGETVDALKDLADAELAARDSTFAFIDATRDVVAAQAEYNKKGGQTFDNAIELQRAWAALKGAALGLEEGIQPAIRNLYEMYNAQVITEAQLNEFIQQILLFSPAADVLSSGAGTMVSALADFDSSLLTVTRDTGTTIYAVAALGRTLAAAGNVMKAYRDMVRAATSGTIQGMYAAGIVLGNAAGNLAGIIQNGFGVVNWGAIGSDIASSIGDGISGGGGSVADAVDDVIQEALDIAAEGIGKINAAISGSISQARAIRDLADAERDLADLREEQEGLPDAIADAEKKLAIARRDAARITAEEQQAIEAALDNFRLVQLAYDQGRATLADLLVAEEELAQARADAVSTDTDEVQDAEEELADLRERLIDLPREIADAEWDLVEAKLAVVDAQLQLIQAGYDLKSLTEEQRDTFYELAEAVGLSRDKIDELLSILPDVESAFSGSSLGSLVGATGGGAGGGGGGSVAIGGGGGGGGGGGALPTGIPIPYVPPPAFGSPGVNFGGVVALHSGGRVPGFPGQEVPAMLQAGELVIPRGSSGGGGGLSIENVWIQGVWDMTNPAETNRMLDNLERQLEVRSWARR